jgi:hypothetical protein
MVAIVLLIVLLLLGVVRAGLWILIITLLISLVIMVALVAERSISELRVQVL